MSLVSPDTSAVDTGRLLAPLVSDLTTWAKTIGGAVFFSRDPLHTLELLAEKPGGFRAVLQWTSDAPAGDQRSGTPSPVLNTTMKLIVSCNPGLQLIRDNALIVGGAHRASLMDLVAQVRFRMMAYRWPGNLVLNGRLSYDGAQPYSLAEYLPFAAYELTFSFIHTTPMPDSGDAVTLTVG